MAAEDRPAAHATAPGAAPEPASADAAGAKAVGALRPVLSVAAAVAMLALMQASIKAVGTGLPTAQVVFLRYLTGGLFILPILLATGPYRITAERLAADGGRAIAFLVAAVGFFYAVARLRLVEAVTLSFTAPLFVVLIARAVLGEPIRPTALAGVAIGFAGVAVVAAGGGRGVGTVAISVDGILAALVGAVAYAAGTVLVRKHSAGAPVVLMMAIQGYVVTVFIMPFGLLAWQPMGRADGLLLALAGALGTVAGLCMAWGLARAEAGRLAVLEYTGLLWAALLGWLAFAETPPPATYAGAVLIVCGCLAATNDKGRGAINHPEGQRPNKI